VSIYTLKLGFWFQRV